MKHRRASQSPLRIHSNVLVQVKALVKDVVANHNDHERYRSEAPPGNVVHQSDMVPEGEAPPDNPEPLVLLEVQFAASQGSRQLTLLRQLATATSMFKKVLCAEYVAAEDSHGRLYARQVSAQSLSRDARCLLYGKRSASFVRGFHMVAELY